MKKIAIIGAGISGLYLANIFKQNSDFKVLLFEKNEEINLDDGYGIQLSNNSVKLLNYIGFDQLDNSQKFFPDNLDFYSIDNPDKICDLNISKFNSANNKYTTIKRSSLIKFLISKISKDDIFYGHDISKIDLKEDKIELSFSNEYSEKFDYLIIADGVFSKSSSLISNSKNSLKFNNSVAIRGTINRDKIEKINFQNISLFLGANFHYVIYPTSENEDLNFIGILRKNLNKDRLKNYQQFNSSDFVDEIVSEIPPTYNQIIHKLDNLKCFPVFITDEILHLNNKNIFTVGDAFFAFPPSFAQGASQSIEGSHELFQNFSINETEKYFPRRLQKTKMVNKRSKFNQFAFHLSNPLFVLTRNLIMKRLVKNEKFLESYLGKIYDN
ncbi:MAG: salicylate 1-monooxygenase [Proteobacteria bacterium]|nr:MAG: salicylate 1-monooxygenase [Pseudomonadota bacterium]|tara:strand:+ start:1169 stop:2320 length:1152 start_codon:yes stop_codon:yes gene_type:complete